MLFKSEAAVLANAKREIAEIIRQNNATTVCFSGHRSQKLPWGFDENDSRCLAVKQTLRQEIEAAVKNGYDTFLSGMALGFDMMCAEIVLELKKTYPSIHLIGVIPCRNQDQKWPREQKKRYHSLLKQTDGVRCIYERYNGAACMLERNRYMINHASLLIALYDGQPGGTHYTVDYATRCGLKVVIIPPAQDEE